MADINALIAKLPDLDKSPAVKGARSSPGRLTGPPWKDAQAIYDAVLAEGAPAIVQIIKTLKEVDDGADFKARYLLHGLALYTGLGEKKREHETVVGAFISELAGDHPKAVKGFLIGELQAVGGKNAGDAVAKYLTDPQLFADAAGALLAIREGAAEHLRAALPGAPAGRCRCQIVQSLGILRDGASLAGLQAAAEDGDADTRIAARWALANIGDAGGVKAALKGADAKDWERIQGVKACLLLAEKLAAAGKKADAAEIYGYLESTRTDKSESYVRRIAADALHALK